MDDETGGASVIWHLIAAVAVMTAVWMAAVGLSFDWAGALWPALACLGLVASATFYRLVRPDERLASATMGTAQLVAFSAVAGPLSYAVARTDAPLWDKTFLAWDLALGLDWRAYLGFIDAHPALWHVYTLAYQSLLPQMLAAVAILSFAGRFTACREFVTALILAAVVSILLSGLLPSLGTYAELRLVRADFPDIDPSAAYLHMADLTGLRAGTFRLVSLRHLEGIITFPSFHAALGVIFARAFWTLRWTRWPGVVLNGLLIASTPIEGGHYFVDVIAGIAIAVVAIAAANRLCSRAPGDVASIPAAGVTAARPG